jgi:predicted transcriptional regulator
LTAALASTTVVVVKNDTLTDLQLAVMKALWGVGEGGVSDVLEALQPKEFP